MEYKNYECDSYNIYTIKTNKFKNCYMEVVFRNHIKKETVTNRIMLADILMQSSKKYNTYRDIRMYCEELYNASIGSSVGRVGNSIVTTFKLSFIDPKYADNTIVNDSIELLFELIQSPNIKRNAFDKNSFNIVKNNLKADILAQKEQPTPYAIKQMLENLNPDASFAINMSGYMDDLDKITPESLIETYNELLETDLCDIYFIGNVEPKEVVKIIDTYFKNRIIKNKRIKLFSDSVNNKKLKTIEEKSDFSQAQLVASCSLNNLTDREKNYVLPIYNVILGNGSLTTKLYKYLREENSLCYTTRSMYQKYDRMIILYAGIDAKNKNLAIKLINKALKEMHDGIISEEEIDGAKKLIVTSLKLGLDNPAVLVDNYAFNVWDNLPDIKTRIEEIKTITIEELINVSRKIKLELVYFLAPGGEENA